MIVDFGPDLKTSYGNPTNILSVNVTYIVGVGGACSVYNEWTAYSRYSSSDLELITNDCSATIMPLPNVVTLLVLVAVTFFMLLHM